jgi:hypothetical protein
LRPADFRLKCVKDSTAQSNIAYQLMMSDLFSWLLNRTDITLTVKEMVIKYEIVIMASIAETLTVIFTTKSKSFKARLPILVSNDKISPETAVELNWMWDFRTGIHLFELDETEHNKYDETHFDRATMTVRKLVDELNLICP